MTATPSTPIDRERLWGAARRLLRDLDREWQDSHRHQDPEGLLNAMADTAEVVRILWADTDPATLPSS